MSFKMLGKVLVQTDRICLIYPSSDNPKKIVLLLSGFDDPTFFIDDETPAETIAAFLADAVKPIPMFNAQVEAALVAAIENNGPIVSVIQKCVSEMPSAPLVTPSETGRVDPAT